VFPPPISKILKKQNNCLPKKENKAWENLFYSLNRTQKDTLSLKGKQRVMKRSRKQERYKAQPT
jgi:hypothetical protein